MDKTIGFIGCGNMGSAMIGGIIKSGLVSPGKVIGSGPHINKVKVLRDKFGINVTTDNRQAAKFSDILVLSVKPNYYDKVIDEIKNYVKENVIIVTIAPGKTIDYVCKRFGRDMKVVRTMPNTPALVGEGMSALCSNKFVDDEELKMVVSVFESFGKAEIIDESLMDTIPAISGSSPAYVYMFIEALADGAVLRGMPRRKAYKMAAQTVLGSAKMVLETGLHPGILKDNVCSPGGTTIDAVYTLEKNNFRGTIIKAMESCTEKTIKMSNQK